MFPVVAIVCSSRLTVFLTAHPSLVEKNRNTIQKATGRFCATARNGRKITFRRPSPKVIPYGLFRREGVGFVPDLDFLAVGKTGDARGLGHPVFLGQAGSGDVGAE